jgi:hypothetical protein
LFQADGSRFPHLGKEYIQMLQDGVIAASYVEGWRSQNKDAVLVAPAHTFLMMNRPVTAQFWLDVGASAWHQRLAQPLTHPHVLTREWEPGRIWTDADDVETAARRWRGSPGLLHQAGNESICVWLNPRADLSSARFAARFQRVLQDNTAVDRTIHLGYRTRKNRPLCCISRTLSYFRRR